MESYPHSAFRKNLEPLEEKRAVGMWSVAGYVDLLSERRFLLCSLRSQALSRLSPDVVSFRLSAASAIAPEKCAPVVDVVQRDKRLELLVAYDRPLDPGALDDEAIRRLMEELIDTIAGFERYCFDCAGLSVDALVLDDDGAVRILPTACALPRLTEMELEGGGGVDDFDDCAARRRRHLERFAVIARGLAGSGHAGAFAVRLGEAALRIDDGTIRTLADLSLYLFDREVDGSGQAFVTRPEEQSPLTLADIGDARVLEISGGGGSGKSRGLEQLRNAYSSAGIDACKVDAWSFADKPRRKSSAREQPLSCPAWLVDDIEDQRVIHADLLDHVSWRGGSASSLAYTVDIEDRRVIRADLPGQAAAGGLLAYTVDPERVTPELAAFLQSLRAHCGDAFVSIRAERGSASTLETVTEEVTGRSLPKGTAPDAAAAALLDALPTEERQIVELVCVAGLPLSGDLVLSVFSGSNGDVHRLLHRLAGLEVLAIDYRPLLRGGNLTVMVSAPSASLRRAVYDCLPEERRRNLHRTVAHLAEAQGGFPAMSVYHHLKCGGELGAAAGHAVAFLRESKRDERAPFIEELIAHFTDDDAVGELAYGDRLFAFRQLGADLFAMGRRADAEKLLLRARDTDAEYEEIQAVAALYGDVMRLLADTWAARGNYAPALELLTDTREFLSPHLSLAEQAQLMNEIGWVQYRLGNYDASVESCKLSLTTLNPNDHPGVVAQALNLMGVIHYNTSRYDEAIGYYEQSAILREKMQDQDALGGSYNNLALAYQSKGEYDKALSYYDKSFEIKRLVNNETGLAAGYLNQALLYLEIHSFDEAEKMCRESLEISTNLGLAQLTAEIHNTLGDIEEKRGHHEAAEEYYRKAIGIASSLETINEEMGARRRLAKLFLTRERHAEAREEIETAARLGAQIGSKYESAQIESILGDLCMAEGQQSEAIDHYEKAAAAYATVSKYRAAATALANIGRAHADEGSTFEAKHYLDRALDLIKSEIGHEIPDEILTLQQTLRERPVRTSLAATEAQKLLYAFYELSSLAEFADDKSSFFKRAIAALQELTGAHSCVLALQTPEGSFVSIRESGDQEPIVDPGLRALLARSLQLGALLHTASPEVSDFIGDLKLSGLSVDARDAGVICVPMKSMGESMGCILLQVSPATLPLSKEETNFITSVGRHIAGDLRLTFHLEEHANKEKTLETEFESLKAQVTDRYRFANLIGKDESMKKVFRTVDRVRNMDTGILITGESGTGKTELARTIHYNSPRHKRPFQEIHCAEIPENLLESELFGHEKGAFTGAVKRKLGLCEVADGGTVFLDDVNVVPPEIQAKLLHYLDNKSFMRLGGTQKITTDVRIIASSNEDLEQLVKQGRFREDLYFRLKVIQVDLPPLRERREDMIAIAQEYLKKRCSANNKPLKALSSETIKLFQRYAWPGNVRELQNVIEQIVLLSDDDIIEPASLPEDFLKRATGSSRHGTQTLQALARQIVEMEGYSENNPLMPQLEALLAHEMSEHIKSKTKAASMLGITKPTLYNRLRGYDKLSR